MLFVRISKIKFILIKHIDIFQLYAIITADK